ncbi:hypothetical protein PQQ63_25405 [Paraburkholderia metrosideri]|uniref:DUF2971 domain-containing protein n=1 Tax=Paraburkholderia metrosideri TaxID=580937 RepID=A0ABW9DXY6_9BURK
MPTTIHIPGQPRINEHLKHDDVLWRYVDAAKFLDFLENSTLFFCRADNFSDKFESAFTPTLRGEIENSYLANRINFTYAQFKQRMRQTVFINCWHKDQDDSAAMWALYGKSECSVALTTMVGRLAECLTKVNLPHDLAIEKVEYIKHWRDPKIDIAPYARVFAYKTKAYQHEKEVRVLLDRSLNEFDAEMPAGGMSIKVDHNSLLRSIVIAPEAPAWFDQLVRRTAARYGLSAPVRRSKLAAAPI